MVAAYLSFPDETKAFTKELYAVINSAGLWEAPRQPYSAAEIRTHYAEVEAAMHDVITFEKGW
jgi:hypothetical protein